LLHGAYILTQIKSGMMIIDLNLAHSRILYEKAAKAISEDIPFSQQLLFPQEVIMDPADYTLAEEILEILSKLGFEIILSGNNKIKINGVPGDMTVGSENQGFTNILRKYRETFEENALDPIESLARAYSFCAALKRGSVMSQQEMRQLVDQLFATTMPYVSPEGKTILLKIPLDEFDKRFSHD